MPDLAPLRRGRTAPAGGRLRLRGARAAAVVAMCVAGACGPAARAGDVAFRALRATVKVSAGDRGGSGFLVALPGGDETAPRTLLVTAAHAFEDRPAPACTVTFRARGGADGYERRDVRLPLRDGNRPLWVRHPTADVAAIGITPPADAEVEPFARDDVADAGRIESGVVRAGRGVWVACYPAQLETHASGWPVLRHGTIASHPLLPVTAAATFLVDYSHFGGDSGSAVVVDADGRPVVAGVVVGMKRQTDRVKSPFEERTMHTPLDLAVAVHPVLVGETIDAWRAAHR